MLKTNEDRIVEFLVQCQPGQPRTKPMWRVGHEGDPFLLPGIGGITLNVQVGDPAFGLAGDHVEPGVSCTANQEKFLDFPNTAVQLYSCVGNRATIVSGAAKGKHGVSNGKWYDLPRISVCVGGREGIQSMPPGAFHRTHGA